jgi:large subunit ribosomal protein L21
MRRWLLVYAIIEASGRQYKVEEGMTLFTERQNGKESGDEIVFDRVILVHNGHEPIVGKPYVDGAKVVGKVVSHGRDKKVLVVKFSPRKNFDRVNGHRQWFTEVSIEKIDTGVK